MILFFFVSNKINYARYGSFYTETMGNIKEFYPNLKPLLEIKGLSVQREDRYAIRTSIKQRGEQTINRDGKTSGGIKSFVSNEKSVLKWYLNRSERARNTRVLVDLCGAGVVNDQYKPCRLSQIIPSENLVASAISVLINEYLNPLRVSGTKLSF